MGRSQVGGVVIDACPSLALLFLGRAEPFHVAIIVVHPHERDIIGYPQPTLVDFHHFLVGHELLRDGVYGAVDVLGEDGSLVVEHFLYQADFLVLGHAHQSRIVYASHGKGVEVLVGGGV